MGLNPLPPKPPGQNNLDFLYSLWGWFQDLNDNFRTRLADRLGQLANLTSQL